VPNGVAFVNTGHIEPNGRLSVDSMDYISRECFDRLRSGKLVKGDIVYCLRGSTIGKTARVDLLEGSVASSLVIIRAKPKVSQEYLYYFLVSPLGQSFVRQHENGSAQPNLSVSAISRYPIPLPPLAEQRAIAAVLGALDDKIELNRRMNATLESMARALFQSWFVDFDPVRAKLDGPQADQPAVLDPATAALFPEHLVDSPLGHIPKGWEVSRLDEIGSVMMGLSPNGESYNADGIGIPLINGPVEVGDYFPVKTKWTEAATRFAAKADLIFCVRGSTGRRVVSDGEYGIGRGVCAIRAKGGYHSFLYQTINVGLDRLLEKTTGSVFPSLSAPDIKGFSVLKPSKDILEAYERTTMPLIHRIQQNHHQSQTLATLRDTLLPKLLSGELSVAAAAEQQNQVLPLEQG
ncbi:MAG: restriction endonuclease subunit S, partial [Planctomyces sp.]